MSATTTVEIGDAIGQAPFLKSASHPGDRVRQPICVQVSQTPPRTSSGCRCNDVLLVERLLAARSASRPDLATWWATLIFDRLWVRVAT